MDEAGSEGIYEENVLSCYRKAPMRNYQGFRAKG